MEQDDDHENRSACNTRESRLKFYKTTLSLTYQSFGVVYGDLCTSPIFVYRNTFTWSLGNYEEDHEILGVLSLVFWTLTIISLCKYTLFVLRADDNGEGGTFALYSLLCRHSKIGFLKNSCVEIIPPYDSAESSVETRTSLLIKKFFEKYHSSRLVLLLLVLLGTSMLIVDGILHPSMSVLSAVDGIRVKHEDLHKNYTVIAACIVLVGLFALQHYGTHRIGFLFAPVLIAWLLCISSIGIYNIIHWNRCVVKALSPYYIYNFFRKTGKYGWISLGGIFLCVTGTEAIFADLGHSSRLSVRIAFTVVVYPCLVLAYMGEAAYLSEHKHDLQQSFYKAIPEVMFWPVFIIATLATAVGSQATISAIFSIISQSRALSCFPRVKIIHTSRSIHGQVYIPEVNWTLMALCLTVVVGFKDTNKIGNAYGLAVISMMLVTTLLMFLIITTVWKQNVLLAALFVLSFGSIELAYFSACLAEVRKGGWLTLIVSLIALSLMSIWHYGTSKKRAFELENKVTLDSLMRLAPSLGINRVPGICIVYTHLSSAVPPMFAHFVCNFPAFHEILVFVTLQSLMVPKVPRGQRFSIARFGPSEISLFRCIVRVGYKDVRESYDFETRLINKILEFLDREGERDDRDVMGGRRRQVSLQSLEAIEEVKGLIEAKETWGVCYMMANTSVLASDSSPFLKKFTINVVYGFLRRNSRRPATAMRIPHTSLIEVGMVYRV